MRSTTYLPSLVLSPSPTPSGYRGFRCPLRALPWTTAVVSLYTVHLPHLLSGCTLESTLEWRPPGGPSRVLAVDGRTTGCFPTTQERKRRQTLKGRRVDLVNCVLLVPQTNLLGDTVQTPSTTPRPTHSVWSRGSHIGRWSCPCPVTHVFVVSKVVPGP